MQQTSACRLQSSHRIHKGLCRGLVTYDNIQTLVYFQWWKQKTDPIIRRYCEVYYSRYLWERNLNIQSSEMSPVIIDIDIIRNSVNVFPDTIRKINKFKNKNIIYIFIIYTFLLFLC